MHYSAKISALISIAIMIILCVIIIPSDFAIPPKSAQNNSAISSTYQITYSISSGGQTESGQFPFMILVNGDDFFFDNGTITYSILANITSPLLVTALSAFFPQEIMSYFENHSTNQTLLTYYSLRRESANQQDLYTINSNVSYTPLWINTTGHNTNYLSAGQLIRFFYDTSPVNLYIANAIADLSATTYQATSQALEQPVALIKAFHIQLTMDIVGSETFNLDLYYDTVWSQLLDAVCSYQSETGNQTSYNFEVNLVQSSLPMITISDNPYWQTALTWYIIGGSALCIGIILIVLIIRRRKKQARQKGVVLPINGN